MSVFFIACGWILSGQTSNTLPASQGTLPSPLHHSSDQGTLSNQIVLTSSLPGTLPSTWHLCRVKNRYWFANVKQLDPWGRQLVANRAEVWCEPPWRHLSVRLIVKLGVVQCSVSCRFPRNSSEWWRDGCQPHFIIYFCYKVGCSKVTYIRRPSHRAAWVTLHILLRQILPWCWWPLCLINDFSFHLTLCAFHVSLGPLRSCVAGFSLQWQLTERLHCRFQGHSPCTHTPLRLVPLKQPQGTACWLKNSKTPPEKAYTPASGGAESPERPGIGFKATVRRQRDGGNGTRFPGRESGTIKSMESHQLGFALPKCMTLISESQVCHLSNGDSGTKS